MARLPLKERAISAVVVIPAAIIVVALALLQYSWSNQVSEATSLRLADSLQMSMINWHLDLFRDFSQVCLALGVDPAGEAPPDLQQFARSFADWKTGAPYPELVTGLYILPADTTPHSPVLRFDAVARRLNPAPLPENLEDLHEKLKTAQLKYQSRSPGTPAAAGGGPAPQNQQFVESFYPGGMLVGWSFDPSVPALVHPISRTGDSIDPPLSDPRSIQWIVLQLNNDAIRARILPDLAQRYFQGTEGLDFQIAVVAGKKTGDVIYSSDSDFGRKEVRDADGTMDLFGRVQDKALGSPVHVFHKPSVSKGPAATVGVSWFPLLADSPADLDWRLIVRHRRGGPMGAFVSELQRRDLMISFGVLFLLVVSMAMLIITSYRAQRLAKLQMNFVTTISHELRTPLTVISSAADNIAHGVVEGKQQLTQYGSVIGNQARQLSGLVEQILLFAATREGRQRYNSRLLNVSEIIGAALANTAGLIRTAQFTVEQNIEPDLPPVMGDLSALSQCLQNLITNALKYGGNKHWIGVRASLKETGAMGREIQIDVSDRGMGIASSDLPHIFEPFYRTSSVAAAQIHGTGLGLPLAKSIAEAMRGGLTVRSVPGQGSTFTLHLPCAEASAQETEVQAAPAIAQH
jgi:signal transduction histidine kinase